MTMNHVSVDLTLPYPDIRPGDVIVGVHSANGIVQELGIDRASDEESLLVYQALCNAGLSAEDARRAVPAVRILARSGRGA